MREPADAPALPPADTPVDGADPAVRRRSEFHGALWLITDIIFLLSMTVLAKLMGAVYPVVQIVFIRAVVGLMVVLPFALARRSDVRMPADMRMQAVRIASNAVSNTCFFAALQSLPLTTMTTISYTRPFVLLACAAAFLGETVGARRWVWTVVAFGGVLLAVRPEETGSAWGLGAAIAAVIFGQISVMAVRQMHEESPLTLMLWHNMGMIAIMGPLTLYFGAPFQLQHALWLIAIGVLGQTGQFCFLMAHRLARASVLAPLGYVNILFAVVAGYAVFNEVPSPLMIAGAGIVLVATLFANISLTSLLRRRVEE